jgi:hypothetical protein
MIISATALSLASLRLLRAGGCIVLSYTTLLQAIAQQWLARWCVTALQRYSAVRIPLTLEKINYTIYLYIYI